MEVVERTIKHVDNFKFQITVPLRHISLNLPDNVLVARDGLEEQRKSLQNKADRATKYQEKIMILKTQGYIEKVDPEEIFRTSHTVVEIPHCVRRICGIPQTLN